MAAKVVDVPDIGPVTLVKSAGNRSIRLSVTGHGVRVSLPKWTPYAVALSFVRQQQAWIRTQLAAHDKALLQENTHIGKLHTLHFMPVPNSAALRTIITPTKLNVPLHPGEKVAQQSVQNRAEKAALKALKKEAEVLLPSRVKNLADKHGYSFESITIKNLKRRWGSCDSRKRLTFNLFLMQLSWQQIDYVICHELAHTVHMDHSADFWRAVERMMPDARMIAKRVRYTQPDLIPRRRTNSLED